MKLTWKTRGGAAPQGKARVYFSGHSVDLERFLEPICRQLFQTQDCAVYYDAEPEAPGDREDWLRQLEQMQLFVLPITGRFLYQPNQARELELPFALERRIPILPLMQEPGLEAEFNRICGDFQLLNQNDPDPTALPYEEKLEKFLSSVLVGDALAAQVRDAFDAYVFLSYRKKDRQYAQRLMRLIHKNDFCRDIAIWYDEFLTPGENFNDAIAEALRKSALFALTVTPSLVEEGNYVMRIEYPEAQKAGKTILPVEMAETDRKKLAECYRDLPPCAQAQDEPGLSAALLEAVQKLAIRENDGSPAHNFFIGLAYLNGIDVEVDRARALKLIVGSAEQGLPEAMEQLVHMYEAGDGVRRELGQAVAWQEKLAAWREARFEETGNQEQGRQWLESLRLLGDGWMELDQLDRGEQVYQKMNQAAQRMAELFPDREEKAFLADSLEALGDAALRRGDQQKAKEYFRQSLSIREQMDREKHTPRLSQDLANNYIRLGRICLDEEYLIGARGYFELGLSRWRQDESRRGKKMRAHLLDRIGEVWQKDGFPDKALECYQESLALCRQLWEETRQFHFQGWMAELYDRMGNVYMGMTDYAQARRQYGLAMEIVRRDYEQDPTPGRQRDLALACVKQGELCRREKDFSGAEQAYRQALEIYSLQAEQIGTIETQDNLAWLYGFLADLGKDQGELAEAQAYLEKELSLCRGILQQSSSLPYRQNAAGCLKELGEICRLQGDAERMGASMRESMEIYRQIAEERGTVQTKWDLADACGGMADYFLLTGEREQALSCRQEQMEIVQQIHRRRPTLRTLRSMAAASNDMGETCRALNRLEEAKQWAVQALDFAHQVWNQSKNGSDYRNMAVSCRCLGDIRLGQGDWEQAKREYGMAVKILRQLNREKATFQSMADLAFLTQRMGETYKQQGELKEAEDYYRESLGYCLQLQEKNPAVSVTKNLLQIRRELGEICQKQNRRREARDYYLAAAELAEELSRQTGEEKDQEISKFYRFMAAQMDKTPLARAKDKVKSVFGKK